MNRITFTEAFRIAALNASTPSLPATQPPVTPALPWARTSFLLPEGELLRLRVLRPPSPTSPRLQGSANQSGDCAGVPEPTAFVLAGTALAFLYLRRTRP
jgi:hypothetical protein